MDMNIISTYISMISDIVVGLSALGAVILAVYSVNQWKREHRGKAAYDLARQIFLLAYEFKAQYDYARNPITFGQESRDRMPQPGESQDDKSLNDEQYVRVERLKALHATVMKLRNASWEADILLSDDVAGALRKLFDHFEKLMSAVNTHFWMRKQALHGRVAPAEMIGEDCTTYIYGIPSDDVGRQLHIDVENLVRSLKLYIK